MSRYPGVYVNEVSLSAPTVAGAGGTVAGFVGITPRGPVGKLVTVTSWDDFLAKFAYGLPTVHLSNAYLPYAVEGFYANAGSGKIYVVRVGDGTERKASFSLGGAVTVTALDEGTWGNLVGVRLTAVTGGLFDLTVLYDGRQVGNVYRNVSLVESAENFVEKVVNGVDNYITIEVTSSTVLAQFLGVTHTLAGGLNGTGNLTDTSFNGTFPLFTEAEDLRILSVPDSQAVAVITNGITYCTNRGDCVFAFDGVEGALEGDILTFRESFTGSYAAMYYPWVLVSDPIGTGATRTKFVPSVGHVVGTIVRTHAQRSLYKAPAGEETVLRGVLGLKRNITDGGQANLNTSGINVIRSFKNTGIVIWGARTLEGRTTEPQKYLNIRFGLNYIKASLKVFLRSAMFEPNNSALWGKTRTGAKAFLLNEYGKGGFKGDTPAEAFFVKCDGEINTPTMVRNGEMKLRAGVAIAEPGEFITLEVGQWDGTVVATEN